MARTFIAVAFILAFAAYAAGEYSASNINEVSWPWDDTKIETTHGPITGVVKHLEGIKAWHDIPFGAPPVGERRFKRPEPVENWTKTLKCSTPKLSKTCTQIKVTGLGPVIGSEDCLYLHVYAPKTLPEKPLPVMFFIYGGGWVIGDGFEFGLYDGAKLVKEGKVILVAPNYRLNIFGFAAHESLQEEDPEASTGNYGIMDQTLALKWTRDNIAKFGGDPDNVTIFGESAGGFSVCHHLVNRDSAGLFHRAIMESGNCDAPEFFTPLPVAKALTDSIAEKVGCKDTADQAYIDCIRSKKTGDLMLSLKDMIWPEVQNIIKRLLRLTSVTDQKQVMAALQNGSPSASLLYPIMPWGSTIDGSAAGLTDMPLNILKSGKFNKVPTVFGTNHDEGSIFVVAAPDVVDGTSIPMTDNDVVKIVKHFFAEKDVDAIVNKYMSIEGKSNEARMSALLKHWFFSCGTRRSLRAIRSHGVDTYLYQFTLPLNSPWGRLLGDFHASELPYVFETWGTSWSKRDRGMSSAFRSFWTNMARSGNPNGDPSNPDTLPIQKEWPMFKLASEANGDDDINIVMTQPVDTNQHLDSDFCDFWDGISPKTLFQLRKTPTVI